MGDEIYRLTFPSAFQNRWTVTLPLTVALFRSAAILPVPELLSDVDSNVRKPPEAKSELADCTFNVPEIFKLLVNETSRPLGLFTVRLCSVEPLAEIVCSVEPFNKTVPPLASKDPPEITVMSSEIVRLPEGNVTFAPLFTWMSRKAVMLLPPMIVLTPLKTTGVVPRLMVPALSFQFVPSIVIANAPTVNVLAFRLRTPLMMIF